MKTLVVGGGSSQIPVMIGIVVIAVIAASVALSPKRGPRETMSIPIIHKHILKANSGCLDASDGYRVTINLSIAPIVENFIGLYTIFMSACRELKA